MSARLAKIYPYQASPAPEQRAAAEFHQSIEGEFLAEG
jgi:hypothetical protein